MASRDDVLVQPDAIGAADLRFLMQHVTQAHLTDSLVSNFDDAVDAEWVVNTAIRNTQEVQLPDAIRKRLRRIDDSCIAGFINPFYAVEVCDREPSQILHYGAGGHYIPHVDAETLYKDDNDREVWERTLDRDLSVVYFLNNDFAGGQLFFPDLDLSIAPAAGTLVCFPSDHNFIHGVRSVTSGHRYTIVTWLRVEGMPTVEEINQATMDEYRRQWPKQIVQPSRLAKGGSRG